MPPGPSSLYDLAAELLAHSETITAATTGGAIPRAFVSVSDPSFDCCPQLSVHARIGDKAAYGPADSAGDPMHRLRYSVNIITMVVTILRCVPGVSASDLPTVAALDASARIVYEDGWMLWNGLQAAYRSGAMWAGYPCRDVSIGPMQPVNPQGGCGGWVIVVTASLDGTNP